MRHQYFEVHANTVRSDNSDDTIVFCVNTSRQKDMVEATRAIMEAAGKRFDFSAIAWKKDKRTGEKV